MNNSLIYSIKVKIFKRFPWRFQSFLKFRPSGIIPLFKNKNITILKKNFPLDVKELKKPIHIETELHENFKAIKIENFHKACSDFFCAKIQKVKIVNNNNVITLIKNNKIIETLSFDPLKREVHPTLTIFCYPKETYLKGKTLLLSTAGAHNNYFHFTIDLLQKLGFAKECGYSLNEFDNILINKLSFKFQKELLQLFNVPFEKIIETELNSNFNCEEVIVPSHSPHNYFGYLFLKKNILSDTSPQNLNFPKRIYISRKNASGRRIVNEEELLTFLAPLNFETIYLENLSVFEQVELFKNIEIVITPHGAGTTNIIYSNSDAALIEIHDIGAPLNTDFYPYVTYGKINYGYIFSETVANPETNHFNFQDIKVNIDQLKQLMGKMALKL